MDTGRYAQKRFKTKGYLKVHNRKHHSIVETVSVEDKKLKSFQCEHCEEGFRSPGRLLQHCFTKHDTLLVDEKL